MPDPVDRLPCQDVVCARGGHFVCHDMPPPKVGGCEMTGDLYEPPDSVEVSEG